MVALDLDTFKLKLKKEVKEGKTSLKTMKGYTSSLEEIYSEALRSPDESLPDIILRLSSNTEKGVKLISAVKKYERVVLDKPKALLYGDTLKTLKKETVQKDIGRDLRLPEDKYLRKINAIKSEKLRLALRLQARTGLRIFEVAALKKRDITYDEELNRIIIHVEKGKGGKERYVIANTDTYLTVNLDRYLRDFSPEDKVFYSESHMRKKAGNLDIPTHDLRRLYSKETFKGYIREGEGEREARRRVQRSLGHKSPKMTDAYIGSYENLEED